MEAILVEDFNCRPTDFMEMDDDLYCKVFAQYNWVHSEREKMKKKNR